MIDNNQKCFLSSKSVYENDHVTLKTGVKATEKFSFASQE